MRRTILPLALPVLLCVAALCAAPAAAPAAAPEASAPSGASAPSEARFPRSAQQAALDGYRLIDQAGLRGLLAQNPPPLLIDTRPDYEFRQGSIPGAQNLPFEPGEAHGLSPAKREALARLLGPDKERVVVVYCRAPQ